MLIFSTLHLIVTNYDWGYIYKDSYICNLAQTTSLVWKKKKLVCFLWKAINYVLGMMAELELTTLMSELTHLLTRCGIATVRGQTADTSSKLSRQACWHKSTSRGPIDAAPDAFLEPISCIWQTDFRILLSQWRGSARVLYSSANVPLCPSLWFLMKAITNSAQFLIWEYVGHSLYTPACGHYIFLCYASVHPRIL